MLSTEVKIDPVSVDIMVSYPTIKTFEIIILFLTYNEVVYKAAKRTFEGEFKMEQLDNYMVNWEVWPLVNNSELVKIQTQRKKSRKFFMCSQEGTA